MQQDRIEVEIVAWGLDLESWSIDYRVYHGDTDILASSVWRSLDELLVEQFSKANGIPMSIARFGIDCGYRTQVVTQWVKRHGFPRVIALKGSDTERQVIGVPATTETTIAGKRIKGSVKHYPVGVSLIKSELYGWLKLPGPTQENPEIPIGYCHFSTNIHTEEYFRQLTAERLEITATKTGRKKYEWVVDYKRNEALDVRVYNRALAFQLGVDRWKRHDAQPSRAMTPGNGNTTPAQYREMKYSPSPRLPRRGSLLSMRPKRLW